MFGTRMCGQTLLFIVMANYAINIISYHSSSRRRLLRNGRGYALSGNFCWRVDPQDRRDLQTHNAAARHPDSYCRKGPLETDHVTV